MTFCGVWGCRRPAVERLVFCNPLCGGEGHLDVCGPHLVAEMRQHLLA